MAMRTQKTEKQRSFEVEALPQADLLYNYALRITNNPEDANDLVQETFLKAFRFWESYEKGTNIRAWMFRIMKNSYINRYRREVREPEIVEYEEGKNLATGLHDETGEKSDVQDLVFANLLDDEIATAVASLPDEFRTVVILCDIEGLTYEEVAEFMECPLGTVRSRLHRGRKLLRKRLGSYARQRGVVPQS
jgi:RNA polymerase sigma-70 factor (ECF subfamily)